VILHKTLKERISTPILTIKYSSRKIDGVTSYNSNFTTADSLSIYHPAVRFEAAYEKGEKASWIVVLVFICITVAVAVVGSVIRVWQYSRRRQMIMMELSVSI
jgi:hypothetical protein